LGRRGGAPSWDDGQRAGGRDVYSDVFRLRRWRRSASSDDDGRRNGGGGREVDDDVVRPPAAVAAAERAGPSAVGVGGAGSQASALDSWLCSLSTTGVGDVPLLASAVTAAFFMAASNRNTVPFNCMVGFN
jgi:hypothetical protein